MSITDEYNETHSTDFFRVLHFEYLKKGKLPDNCKNYLNLSGDQFPIKSCH